MTRRLTLLRGNDLSKWSNLDRSIRLTRRMVSICYFESLFRNGCQREVTLR